jgi:hypothetical protein
MEPGVEASPAQTAPRSAGGGRVAASKHHGSKPETDGGRNQDHEDDE